jgi:hypothetical protein
LGLYVEEKHRGIGIKMLIDSALKQAEIVEGTVVDLLISEDQESLQNFLEKTYNFFTKIILNSLWINFKYRNYFLIRDRFLIFTGVFTAIAHFM